MSSRLLDRVMIAAPCGVPWSSMQGNDTVRSCSGCSKNVYNIADMTSSEAEEFLERNGATQCMRLYRRADGTIITDNCPRGLRKIRDRFRMVAAFFAGLVTFGFTPGAASGQAACDKLPHAAKGQPMPVYEAAGGMAYRPLLGKPVAPRPTPEPATFVEGVLWERPRGNGIKVDQALTPQKHIPLDAADTSAMELFTEGNAAEKDGRLMLARTLYTGALRAATANPKSDPRFKAFLKQYIDRMTDLIAQPELNGNR